MEQKNYRKITAHGETLSIAEWSKKTGLHHSTITNRLDLGWPHEDIVGKPSDKRYTTTKNCRMNKNEAELLLNDTPYEQLPKCLTGVIAPTKRPVMAMGRAEAKYGHLFRRKHPAAFQKWFNETHCQPNPAYQPIGGEASTKSKSNERKS